MILKASTGISFSLEILRYQFPHIENCKYDSNWLMIRIDVSHPRGDWTSIDPSLLTFEVAGLTEWLDAIHHNEPAQPVIRFVEPNLEFHLVTTAAGKKALRVSFQLESLPPWATDSEVCIEFPLDEIDLTEASHHLRVQLQRFPMRA
ncbi:MAG: hypothetical protein JXA42_11000 [Anaerolineales bacterium]|nr:hypothetical protein [Anaerolineales bacterium]